MSAMEDTHVPHSPKMEDTHVRNGGHPCPPEENRRIRTKAQQGGLKT